MKKKVYSAVILLSLSSPALVHAADETDSAQTDNVQVHGTVELGVQAVDTSGDKARAQEFRDLDNSVLGNIQIDALKDAYHFEVDGENIGLDDQSLKVTGGEFDNFKYKFDYDEFTHNYGFDAVTPYTGVGSNHLALPTTVGNAATWTHYDDKVDHKRYGGGVEINLHSPYFVNLGVDRQEQSGLFPYSTHQLANTETPEPISNSTDNLHLQVGYRGEKLIGSITGLLSSFGNSSKYMQESKAGVADKVDYHDTFAQDNDYKKLNGELTFRDLPLNSVLSTAASYSNLANSYSIADLGLTASILTAGGVTNLNRSNFDGEVDYTSFSVALSSNPLDKLDSKIYYDYLNRDNKSSIISFVRSGNTYTNADELLSYGKNKAGIDLGYKFPQKTKLGLGYEYSQMDRSTPSGLSTDPNVPGYTDGNYQVQNDNTKDNTYYVELKNSMLDWVTAKLRYTYMKRNGADSYPVNFTQPFYYLDQSSNAWKLGFDLYPVDCLDLGLDYTYKKTSYDDHPLSRTGDTRHNVYLDATWRVVGKTTLTGSVGYEKVETDSNGVQYPQTYTQETADNFWSYGLAANVPGLLDKKLTLNVSWKWQKSDGEIDFNNYPGATYQNIPESDDYTKKTLEAKATYALDSKLSMTVGYIYEKFEYNDISIANYPASYIYNGNYYLSGIGSDPNYENNVGYLMLKYGF